MLTKYFALSELQKCRTKLPAYTLKEDDREYDVVVLYDVEMQPTSAKIYSVIDRDTGRDLLRWIPEDALNSLGEECIKR